MRLPPALWCRRVAGWLFLTGNFLLFVTNFYNMNVYQFCAALTFMSCSVSLILSAKNFRWLYYAGFALITAYVLLSLGAEGKGTPLQVLGTTFGFLGGILDWRAALQQETGKQYNLPKPFNLADEYPLAASAAVEGSCNVLIFLGALISLDIRLSVSAFIWLVGFILLGFSDLALRKRLGF